MEHPIAAPGSAPEFNEGDFEEFEVDKDQPMEDDGVGDDLGEEIEDDCRMVDEDDGFVEASTTWGASLPDSSLASYNSGKEIMAVAVRPSGVLPAILAVGGMDDCVTFLDAETLTPILKAEDPEETVNTMKWSPDGMSLAAGCLSGDDVPGRIFIYTVNPSTNVPEFAQMIEGPGDDVEWIEWHPRGPCIMAGFADGTVWVWMTKTGNLYNILVGHGGPVTCGQFVDNGKRAVTASADGGIIVWSLNTATIEYHLRPNPQFFGTYDIDQLGGHSNAIISLACHPSLPLVATGAEDNSVKIFNYETKKVVKTLIGFKDTIETLKWFPSETNHLILAAGSLDGSVIVWNGALEWRVVLESAHTLPEGVAQEGEARLGGVTRLHWLVDTKMTASPLEQIRTTAKVASVSLDGTLRIWAFGADGTTSTIHGGALGALVALDSAPINSMEGVVYCAGDDGQTRMYRY